MEKEGRPATQLRGAFLQPFILNILKTLTLFIADDSCIQIFEEANP
jgi:hypothetical protein